MLAVDNAGLKEQPHNPSLADKKTAAEDAVFVRPNILDIFKEEENNSESIQDTPKEEKDGILHKILGHFFIKNLIPEASHFLSIFGNGAATVANMFNMSDTAKSFADACGRIGTRIFLVANGAINALEYFAKNNFLGGIGHFMDIFVGFGAKHEHAYLDRGNPVGTYTYANTISNMNGRDSFESLSDHIDHIKEGLKKSYENLFSKDFFRNFKDVNKGMAGIISGFFCNLGSLVWYATGMEKLGTVLRDLGGIFVDFEQAHPGHLAEGRPFYFASGLGLLGGTISDFLAKMLPYYKKTLVPLSLAIDSFGRYLLRMSHNRNEMGKSKVKALQSSS